MQRRTSLGRYTCAWYPKACRRRTAGAAAPRPCARDTPCADAGASRRSCGALRDALDHRGDTLHVYGVGAVESDSELDFQRDEEFHVLQRGPVIVVGTRQLGAERQPVAEHFGKNGFDSLRDVFYGHDPSLDSIASMTASPSTAWPRSLGWFSIRNV